MEILLLERLLFMEVLEHSKFCNTSFFQFFGSEFRETVRVDCVGFGIMLIRELFPLFSSLCITYENMLRHLSWGDVVPTGDEDASSTTVGTTTPC